MFQITFTQAELQELGRALDVAVRAEGLKFAANATILLAKLQSATPLEVKKEDTLDEPES
jgi:hypothetical protein